MKRVRVLSTALVVAISVLGVGNLTSEAKAVTEFDGFLHKAPSLYVYTDWPANTQTMDISGSWWSDYKQAYTKRVGIDGWPVSFVPQFESFMATGSWAVFLEESPDGTTVSMFGTSDPNAYCDFSAPSEWVPEIYFGCTSHAGFDFATASYFTHNSYGGNGCAGTVPPYNFCSDNGMNMYSHPVTGHAGADVRFWNRFPSGSLNFYAMNFDVRYPEGYAGEQIGTKPGAQPPLPVDEAPPDTAEPLPTESTVPLDPPGSCPKVLLIGVRGSGEASGLGRVVGGFSAKLKAAVRKRYRSSSYPFYAYPVVYPAVSVLEGLQPNGTWSDPLTNRYVLSVTEGANTLIDILNGSRCVRSSQVVLVGYSQGAQVIAHVLMSANLPRSISNRIKMVVFFGDPNFNAVSTEVQAIGGFSARLGGVLGKRRSNKLRAYNGRYISVCRKHDIVCQYDSRKAAKKKSRKYGIARHGGYGKDAVEFSAPTSQILKKLR